LLFRQKESHAYCITAHQMPRAMLRMAH
jgi:hypothetical protein